MTVATDLTDELSAFQQECEKQTARYKKLMQTKGKELFVKVVKGFFDATPQVAQVSWTQYTPYFNDGEACEFGVHEPQFLLHGEHEKDDVPYSENSINEKYNKHWREKTNANERERLRKLVKMFQSIDDDVFLYAFGDHVKISASLDQKREVVLSVTEYNHD